MTSLFTPIRLRDMVIKNRIGMSPMCQYSAENGVASDWHFNHYGSRAVGGAGLIVVEATAVTPDGRISPGDLGLWHDSQMEPLSRIVRFNRQHGCATAVQLAHAGRKASVTLGWQEQRLLGPDQGGWNVVAPSALAFDKTYALPHELTGEDINGVVQQFAAAARRAVDAGFDAVEIHAAHGYLIHQFLSPLSNRRTDSYGGSFMHRTRFVRDVIAAVRAVMPEGAPLLLRLSATDWHDAGWNLEETIELCRTVQQLGVDLVDVSSGGLVPGVSIPVGPGYQSGLASRIRHEAGLLTAAVGMISSPEQADHILRTGQADMVFIGRTLLRNPYWPLMAASALNQTTDWPAQYLRAAPPATTARQV